MILNVDLTLTVVYYISDFSHTVVEEFKQNMEQFCLKLI